MYTLEGTDVAQRSFALQDFAGGEAYLYSDEFLSNFRSKEQNIVVRVTDVSFGHHHGLSEGGWISNRQARPAAIFSPSGHSPKCWQHALPGQGKLLQAEAQCGKHQPRGG